MSTSRYKNPILDRFLHKVFDQVADYKRASPEDSVVDFPMSDGQCFYVFDWQKNEVTHASGVQRLLGYEPNELNVDLLTTFIHPDDIDIVSRVTKGSIDHAINNEVPAREYVFLLTCRLRKKDGSYVRILRQSGMYELDDKQRMISNFSILTDVSFMKVGNGVWWEVRAPNLDAEQFRKSVGQAFSDFFSRREFEILSMLAEGKLSKEISSLLNISVHTVDTHRRKMLKKAAVGNTVELINFARQNMII